MRYVALAAVFVGVAACGDNGNSCDYVEVLIGERNVWSPMFAVDDTYIYYADYDVDDFGSELILRANRDTGHLVSALANPQPYQNFGNGLALDDKMIYWTASSDPTGESLYESPRYGGETYPLGVLPNCVPFGMTTSDTEVFVGSAGCGDLVSRVTALDKATGHERIVWQAGMYDGDVRSLAYVGDTLFIGTTAALFAVRPSGTEVITAGNAVRHLEIHDDYLYFSSEADGIYRTPIASRSLERLYAYATTGARQGPFSLDGTDLYVSEPPQMLLVTPGKSPEIVVEKTGSVSEIVARDGYAWWSALVLPNGTNQLDTFSGGIMRVTRPCD